MTIVPETKMEETEETAQEHYESCKDHPHAPLADLGTFREARKGVEICLDVRICSECKHIKRVSGRKFVFLLEVYKNDEPLFFAANKAFSISDARKSWLAEIAYHIQKSARSLGEDDLREGHVLNSLVVSINDQLQELADRYEERPAEGSRE